MAHEITKINLQGTLNKDLYKLQRDGESTSAIGGIVLDAMLED